MHDLGVSGGDDAFGDIMSDLNSRRGRVEVPKQLQEKIVAESKKAKEAQAAAH